MGLGNGHIHSRKGQPAAAARHSEDGVASPTYWHHQSARLLLSCATFLKMLSSSGPLEKGLRNLWIAAAVQLQGHH